MIIYILTAWSTTFYLNPKDGNHFLLAFFKSVPQQRISIRWSVRRSICPSIMPPWKSKFSVLFSRGDMLYRTKHSSGWFKSLFTKVKILCLFIHLSLSMYPSICLLQPPKSRHSQDASLLGRACFLADIKNKHDLFRTKTSVVGFVLWNFFCGFSKVQRYPIFITQGNLHSTSVIFTLCKPKYWSGYF